MCRLQMFRVIRQQSQISGTNRRRRQHQVHHRSREASSTTARSLRNGHKAVTWQASTNRDTNRALGI
ncbi:hypothetical protein Ddc_15795 [Ditylenchus destructor]|nr:hypothetical protein Ddc_15795 [Ditylenchus destructor]